MKDRLLRFGSAGIISVLSMIFGFWYSGGEITKITSSKIIDADIYKLAITILAAPVFGLILSTIIVSFLKQYFPEKSEYLGPSIQIEQDYLEMIMKNCPRNSGVSLNNNNNYIISDFRLVYLNHQLLLREEQYPEIMKFTTRRMDFYWTHVNNIFSTIFGLIIGIFLNAYTDSKTIYCISLPKVFWIIPIVTYIYFAWKQALRNRYESNEFEKIFLIEKKHKNA